ncbi:SGNH/GDSL hydrolase family protein [Ectobacillus funiculus]|uniref:SGNH/GDSL hydrolase family protein n=1 Tax=Ectobacillus funiculus TaxID=137993 RepID=A0ABV5WKK7_9BACI
MKRVWIFTVTALLILSITCNLYLFFEKKDEKTVTRYSEEPKKSPEEIYQDMLTEMKQSSHKSMIDFLRYTSYKNGSAKIVALGDSVTYGVGASPEGNDHLNHSWVGLLQNYVGSNVKGIRNVKIVNKGFPGHTTSQLLKENRINEVIAEQPDIVIFEVCLLNNQRKSVSLEQTNADIKTIVKEIHKQFPETLIVLQSPNPSTTRVKANKLGLTYKDYLDSTKTYVTSKGWYYIDIHTAYEKAIHTKKLPLEQTLIADGVHPNDIGYNIWFDILKNAFSEQLTRL